MLIVFKANLKLPIIGWFLPLLGLGEELHDVIFGKQTAPKDSHDLHDRSSKFEVVLDDSDETVCDDGNMYLNAHRIIAFSPERLDPEMLLNPFKKQFDLPSVSIKKSDVFSCKFEVVCVVCKRAIQVRSIVNNTSDLPWILLCILLSREDNGLVSTHVVCSFKNVFSGDNLVRWMPLLTNDKEGTASIDSIKSSEVKVASIKYMAGLRFVCEPVHSVNIMDIGIGDSVEYRYLRNDVHLSVDFDSRLRTPELSPFKERHAEVDGCRVNGIKSAMKLELSREPSLLCKEHHVECKLFKDAIVPELVCLGKIALINGFLSESEMKRLLTMSNCYICEFSQPSAAHELTEHENKQLTPGRWTPVLGSVVELGHKALEISLRQKVCYLRENVLSDMHKCSDFDSDAKVSISKVRQGFRILFYCV